MSVAAVVGSSSNRLRRRILWGGWVFTFSHEPYCPGPQPDWQSELTPKSNTVPVGSEAPLDLAM